MVQSMIVPEGEINIEQLWKDVSPDQLMDAKLRCTFETPTEKINEKSVSQLTTQMLKNESGGSENLSSSMSNSATDAGNKSGDTDFVRATAEVRELREENSKMHQENLELKVKEIFFDKLKIIFKFFLGASNTLEDNDGVTEGHKLIIAVGQNNFKSILAASTWTTTNAYNLGDCGCRHGDFWIDSWKVCPLNALSSLISLPSNTKKKNLNM